MPRESLEMLTLIEGELPSDQPKLRAYIGALRQSIEAEEREAIASEEELAQFRAAYEKLTQPANRIGVFLKWIETKDVGPLAFVLLGDSEYVVTWDPKIDPDQLLLGTRVRLNEAYAIVGFAPSADLGSIAKVSEIVDENRIQIGGDQPGEGTRLVFRAEALTGQELQPGDRIRLDPTGRFAVELLQKSDNKDYFVEEVPEISWEQVGGQKEAIRLIRETIEQPLLYPEIFEAYGKKPIKGILLYGPPGCGKTLLGKATAHNLAKEYSKRLGREVKECFLSISGPKILNMWVGETERMVREIFATARARAKEGQLVFVFMDEAESLLRTRSSGRYFSMSNTVVPQFCAELDGLVELENVVLMLTSNRPDYIDPAILRPGRIDRKVKVERPDKDACRQILNIYLSSTLPFDPEVLAANDNEPECARRALVEIAMDEVWRKTSNEEIATIYLRNGNHEILHRSDLVSGAILESIIDRAKEIAIRRSLENREVPTGLKSQDITDAVQQEFAENDILPKSDQVEDWVQLLDVKAENCVAVKTRRTDEAKSRDKSFGTRRNKGIV